MRTTKLITEIIVSLLALLFSYAAISKLLTFPDFTLELGKSPLLHSFPFTIGSLVITTETLIVLALLVHKWRTYGLYASFFLLTVFTAYLVITIHFSYYVPCSCGGILSELSWNQHIIFNALFILLAMIGIYLIRQDRSKILARKGKAENL